MATQHCSLHPRKMLKGDREEGVLNHTSSSGASHADVVACSVTTNKDEETCEAQLRLADDAPCTALLVVVFKPFHEAGH